MDRPKIPAGIATVTHRGACVILRQPAGHGFWLGVALMLLSAVLVGFFLASQLQVSTFTSGIASGGLRWVVEVAFDFLFGPPLELLLAALAMFLLGLACATHGQTTLLGPDEVVIRHSLAGLRYFQVRIARRDVESFELVADSTIGQGDEAVVRSYGLLLRCKTALEARFLWKQLDIAAARPKVVREHRLAQGIPPQYAEALLAEVRRACPLHQEAATANG